MATAFIFPGQGSQAPGMGRDLYESLSEARTILDNAADILDFDIKKMMFEGPEEVINDTQYSQPLIYTCNAMYLAKAASMGLSFDYAAGHSLGEYSALYASNVISFSEGLKLVRERGLAMSRQNGKGTMSAVVGLTEEVLAPYIEKTKGEAVIANYNTPTQLVISGTESAIALMERELSGRDSVIIKRLNVSAAFHSPQMKAAAEIFTPYIEKTEFNPPCCPVVSNVTALPTTDVDEIRNNLIRQIEGQVKWYDSILNMTSAGVDEFYEIGYGKVLRGMNRRISGAAKCLGI